MGASSAAAGTANAVRRSARPGNAPVSIPWSNTIAPFTHTVRIPTEMSMRIVDGRPFPDGAGVEQHDIGGHAGAEAPPGR